MTVSYLEVATNVALAAVTIHIKLREILRPLHVASLAFASFSTLLRLRPSRRQNAFASDARRRKNAKTFASAQFWTNVHFLRKIHNSRRSRKFQENNPPSFMGILKFYAEYLIWILRHSWLLFHLCRTACFCATKWGQFEQCWILLRILFCVLFRFGWLAYGYSVVALSSGFPLF